MSKTRNELPILVRTLQALKAAGAAGMTTAQLAETVGVRSKVIANAVWYQRRAERLTTDEEEGRHSITELGSKYLQGVLGGVLKRSRKLPYKRPRKSASTAVVAIGERTNPAPSPREHGAARHADSLIVNARQAIDIHERLLDESVELTPLVRSTIDGMRRAVDLIESAYQIARA